MRPLKFAVLPFPALTALALSAFLQFCLGADAQQSGASPTITGAAAFHGYETEKPGVTRKLTVADLPEPRSEESVDSGTGMVARPSDAWPQAPKGFKVEMYATGLDNPRLIRMAPNGDMFVAESEPGKILVFRGVTGDGKPGQMTEFATGLNRPFGIAFYPLGGSPKWVYIGDTDQVLRFPYQNGDTKARGEKEIVVKELPGFAQLRGGGHWTRDVVFSKDGTKMLVSVGSGSNVDDPDTHPKEFRRADVLQFTPEGKFLKVYAYGIRNCVGEAINPITGQLWCSTNERDGLGNNLVPDYITHIEEDGFYGWPWWYMGQHQDPRHEGKHPELKAKVITPDVILQPHYASLEMTFYEASQFPAEYKGDAFAAEHGSWNRLPITGYEVIRVPMKDGKATGPYEDFLTGFVTADGHVWGRPVGVAVGKDGSLFVTDDGSKSIWHVSYTGK